MYSHTNFSLGQVLWFSILNSQFYIYTHDAVVLDYLIGAQDSLLCFVVSCHSIVFFLSPALLQKRTKKDRVCVGGVVVGGVQEWYREIDEAVRAGVITRCPFPKPDWQTANITQTPGPDRHTTNPPTTQLKVGRQSTPTFSRGLMVCGPTDFPMWYYSCRNWASVYWQGKLLSGGWGKLSGIVHLQDCCNMILAMIRREQWFGCGCQSVFHWGIRVAGYGTNECKNL